MFYIYHRRSAFRRIARELGVSTYYPYEDGDCIIRRSRRLICDVNIGCHRLVTRPEGMLNANLDIAISKKRTFESLTALGVRHPPVFDSPEDASTWEYGWLGRRDGLSGGRGISIFEKGQLPLQAAQFDFCVGIIPVKAEYRIHVGKLPNKKYHILATQQKIGVRDSESLIHNHANGIIFSTQELRMSAEGRARANSMAIQTVCATSLDFGAVDLVQGQDGRLYVLEVNTAPGITSQPMFQTYKNYFIQWMVS